MAGPDETQPAGDTPVVPAPEDNEVAPRKPQARRAVSSRFTDSQTRDLTRIAGQAQRLQSKHHAEIARLATAAIDTKQLAATAGVQRIAEQLLAQNTTLAKHVAQVAEQIRAGQLAAIRAAVPDHRTWLESLAGTHALAVSQVTKGWTPDSFANLVRLRGVVPAAILEPTTMDAFRQIMGDRVAADAAAASFAAKVARDAQAAALRQMGVPSVEADDERAPVEVSDAFLSLGVSEAPESAESFVDLADIDDEAALDAARAAWDAEVERSLDAAADAIVANSPWLSRDKVRLGIKVFVLVVWVTGYTALAFVPGLTGPVLMGLIGAIAAAPTIADATERVLPKPEDPAN